MRVRFALSPVAYRRMRLRSSLLALCLLTAGCSPPSSDAASESTTPPTRNERPLPQFQGVTLDGKPAGTELFRRRRGLVYVFASSDGDADRVAKIVSRLQPDLDQANIVLLGVNRNIDPSGAGGFLKRHGFEFPVIVDRGFTISRKLGIPGGSSSLIAVDAEGFMIGGFAGLEAEGTEIEEYHENELRRVLHLERPEGSVVPALGTLPKAPAFEVKTLKGEKLASGSLEGQVVVLMFFSPTCPHCHESLKFFNQLEKKLSNPELKIVPVSVSDRRYVIEDMADNLDLQLTIYTDPDKTAARSYAHRHLVPDIIVIDREGQVISRRNGSDARAEALLTMEIRHALGVENPLLLDRTGYSGEESCRTCHRNQHQTWALTSHAYAFETLVEHGADRDPECLSCHTVGWGLEGGYSLETPYPHLQGVQCENCHGRGGPHQSPDFAKRSLEEVCVECHNPKHSLNFSFAERLPDVSHSMNLQFAGLSLEERQALLEKRDKRKRTLFHSGRFVGSDACQECHSQEHELWAKSGHARAFETLKQKGSHQDADCQACHTTGFKEPGGFPEGGEAVLQVGCESCHGPGENHVKSEKPGPGTILALTDKCDSCVILQICGSCHDDKNDPGFEFELLDKLDAIRHGFRDHPAGAQGAE